jgi:hypothetical protein
MLVLKKLEFSSLDIVMKVDSNGLEILDEQIVHQNNSFVKVKRWIKGRHPEMGKITWGYTGFETIVEKDVIKPSGFFEVGDNDVYSRGIGTYD